MIIKAVLDKRYMNAEGKYPVKIKISGKYKATMISLNINVAEDEFDKQTGLLKTSDRKKAKENTRINNAINEELLRIHDYLLEFRRKHNCDPTPSELRGMYLNFLNPAEEKKIPTLNEYFELYSANKSEGTQTVFRTTLNKLEELYGTLEFEDITFAWLEKFNTKMKAAGLKTNTRSIHFRNIRAIFNHAIDNEIIGLEKYPFRRFKIEQEKTRKRAISVADLRTLFAYQGTKEENWAIDMSKLIFFLIGINTKDLHYLNEYENGYVHYRRAKTGTLYSIKVEPEAELLLQKYKGKNSLLSFQEQFILTHSFTGKINDYLRNITKKAELPHITTYTLRHTWATLAAELEIPKETIAAAMGHAQNSVTDIYIAFNRKKVDEANRKVIDYVLSNK